MKLAVLFWFYKDDDVCRNRLELLKQYNPDLEIFGLYGGMKSEIKKFKKSLDKYFKDFYISEYCEKSSAWKWINGDRMILSWYLQKGRKLNWDSVVVIQWDALVLGSIKKQFPSLKKDQIFLSGLRRLDSNIENRWSWTKPGNRERTNFLAFKNYLKVKYQYTANLLCSLFIIQIFSRSFFEAWGKEKDSTLGMLEYTLPTFAKIFRTPIYNKDLGVWWFNKTTMRDKTPLNARGVEINKSFIAAELKNKKGFRIFHPYNKVWK